MQLVDVVVQVSVCLAGEVRRHRLGLRVGVHDIPKNCVTILFAWHIANHFLEFWNLTLKQ